MNTDWINVTCLIILGIATIRDLLATFIFKGMPIKTKFLNDLLYGSYDENILIRCLQSLGYNERESITIKKRLTRRNVSITNELECLMIIIFNYIIYFQSSIKYSNEKQTQSHYYINTMEASHNPKDLDMMASLLEKLILNECDKNNLDYPDFVLVHKNGNPILAQKLTDNLKQSTNKKVYCIVKKKTEEKSFINSKSKNLESFLSNFEGAWEVYNEQCNRELYGVVVDCNTSGGSQLKECITGFNEVIKTNKLKIKPINKAYVLFRVDEKHVDIDSELKNAGISLKRYFDLNEDAKEYIYHLLHLDMSTQLKPRGYELYGAEDKEKVQNALTKVIKKLEE